MSLKLRERETPGLGGRGFLALGVLLLLLFQRLSGYPLNTSRRFFRTLTRPLLVPAQMVLQLTHSVGDRFTDADSLRAEIRRLKTEVTKAQLEARLGKEAKLQAERLKDALSIRRTIRERLPDTPLYANVVGASISRQERRLTLDLGSKDGVTVDSPVIYGEDVLGRVVSVSETKSRVLLIQDIVSALGILIEGNRTPGVAQGTGGELLTLSEFPDKTYLSEGALVLTGSLSSYYPKGLVVGVLEADGDNWVVRPRRNPTRIEEAFVVPLHARDQTSGN